MVGGGDAVCRFARNENTRYTKPPRFGDVILKQIFLTMLHPGYYPDRSYGGELFLTTARKAGGPAGL